MWTKENDSLLYFVIVNSIKTGEEGGEAISLVNSQDKYGPLAKYTSCSATEGRIPNLREVCSAPIKMSFHGIIHALTH